MMAPWNCDHENLPSYFEVKRHAFFSSHFPFDLILSCSPLTLSILKSIPKWQMSWGIVTPRHNLYNFHILFPPTTHITIRKYPILKYFFIALSSLLLLLLFLPKRVSRRPKKKKTFILCN